MHIVQKQKKKFCCAGKILDIHNGVCYNTSGFKEQSLTEEGNHERI